MLAGGKALNPLYRSQGSAHPRRRASAPYSSSRRKIENYRARYPGSRGQVPLFDKILRKAGFVISALPYTGFPLLLSMGTFPKNRKTQTFYTGHSFEHWFSIKRALKAASKTCGVLKFKYCGADFEQSVMARYEIFPLLIKHLSEAVVGIHPKDREMAAVHCQQAVPLHFAQFIGHGAAVHAEVVRQLLAVE